MNVRKEKEVKLLTVVVNSNCEQQFQDEAFMLVTQLMMTGYNITAVSRPDGRESHIVVTDTENDEHTKHSLVRCVYAKGIDQSNLSNDSVYFFNDFEELANILVFICETGLEKFIKIGA